MNSDLLTLYFWVTNVILVFTLIYLCLLITFRSIVSTVNDRVEIPLPYNEEKSYCVEGEEFITVSAVSQYLYEKKKLFKGRDNDESSQYMERITYLGNNNNNNNFTNPFNSRSQIALTLAADPDVVSSLRKERKRKVLDNPGIYAATTLSVFFKKWSILNKIPSDVEEIKQLNTPHKRQPLMALTIPYRNVAVNSNYGLDQIALDQQMGRIEGHWYEDAPLMTPSCTNHALVSVGIDSFTATTNNLDKSRTASEILLCPCESHRQHLDLPVETVDNRSIVVTDQANGNVTVNFNVPGMKELISKPFEKLDKDGNRVPVASETLVTQKGTHKLMLVDPCYGRNPDAVQSVFRVISPDVQDIVDSEVPTLALEDVNMFRNSYPKRYEQLVEKTNINNKKGGQVAFITCDRDEVVGLVVRDQ